MNSLTKKVKQQALRKLRVRRSISASADRPRLSIHVSNRHITAQIIDDTTHKTLAYVSTTDSKVKGTNMTERAQWVGEEIAKKAKTAKVQRIVLDRGSHLYHGRVKALADKARESGLEF